jgi:hypothetical protein
MANYSHHNKGRSWSADRAKFNKNEDWEIPMNERANAKRSKSSGTTKSPNSRGYEYIPNRMLREAEIENKGKTTYIDAANILDGIYVKKGTKYEEGGDMMEKGGKVKNYKYIPNHMIQAMEVERKGKTTEIDGANILDGIYVKGKTKFEKGGSPDIYDFDNKMALINISQISEYAIKLDNIVQEDSNLEEWVKMKLTRVEQNVADVKKSLNGWNKFEDFEDGGRIFKKQLLHIAKYTDELMEMIKSGSKLMSWQENKLAVSAEYIDGIYHHLDYKGGNRAADYNKFEAELEYEAGGGVAGILKLYQKDTFSDKDSELIDEAIENGDIDTSDIKEDCMGYIYDRLEKEFGDKYSSEEIWEYTDENLSNGLTHKENYKNLVEYLKDNEYEAGGGIDEYAYGEFESGGGVGLKVSDLKKGDRLKKKGSALEVYVLEVGTDWRSGYDYALIETPFGNPQSYIDVSDFVFSDEKPQYAFGGNISGEISKEQLESMVGRKLNGWNDDKVMFNGTMYQKCFLRPFYKKC